MRTLTRRPLEPHTISDIKTAIGRARTVSNVLRALIDGVNSAAGAGAPTSATAAQIAIPDRQWLDLVQAAVTRLRQLGAADAAIASAVHRLFDHGPHAYDDAA